MKKSELILISLGIAILVSVWAVRVPQQSAGSLPGARIGGSATSTSVAVPAGGVQLLAGNPSRNVVEVCNATGSLFYVQPARASSAAPAGIPLSYLGCYSIGPDNLWIGPIFAITQSGDATASIQEF